MMVAHLLFSAALAAPAWAWRCNCTVDGAGCYINETLSFDAAAGRAPPMGSNLGPLPVGSTKPRPCPACPPPSVLLAGHPPAEFFLMGARRSA